MNCVSLRSFNYVMCVCTLKFNAKGKKNLKMMRKEKKTCLGQHGPFTLTITYGLLRSHRHV